MLCPNCKLSETKKNGFNQFDRQRYFCWNCRRQFTPKKEEIK